MILTPTVRAAIVLLRRGEPLPVDTQTKLLELGIDLAKFEARHSI